MDVTAIVLDILLGSVLGVVGGLFGIGGGLIAIPVLGLLFGLDQQLAQGTALVMVVPNVLVSIIKYNQRNRIDWRRAGILSGAGILSAIAGAMLAVGLDADLMRKGFVVFLLFLVAYNLWQLRMKSHTVTNPPGVAWLAVLGVFAGLVGGLFGVGGAVIATPMLTSVFGLSQVVAQGLSLTMALPATSITLATYAIHHEVDWLIGIPLAIGGFFSVGWGVRMAHALPERLLRGLFCGFLLVCAILLALK
ncbi:sulfite exporter TauE/SafE family protein [Pseudomonas luteola]|jgi:uncharacterized membrane protein YfcA|uniref:sulfite exporter TauE/SafE family protein n=1 Tax=Pseudomonas TaxID=286 RepID=UPI000F7A6EB3|nr:MULTISPECIES: sulfite exporter TauE/SafE family protein [Pseudomonas]MBW5413236.1 TSUP family transporter [Pseudomonas sp. MAG002Y]RRW46231.1 sulfite exporter TauE/SafE family protein [Pseudomonas luteola]